jgi:hypothetical protein
LDFVIPNEVRDLQLPAICTSLGLTTPEREPWHPALAKKVDFFSKLFSRALSAVFSLRLCSLLKN